MLNDSLILIICWNTIIVYYKMIGVSIKMTLRYINIAIMLKCVNNYANFPLNKDNNSIWNNPNTKYKILIKIKKLDK